MLLCAMGGAAALALAYAAMRLLLALRPGGIPRLDRIGLDAGVLAVTLVVTVATGVIFGVAPAIGLARTDPGTALNEGPRTASVGRGRQRIRDVLPVAQTALSTALLTAAVLLLRSLAEFGRIELGFDPRHAPPATDGYDWRLVHHRGRT